MAYPNSPAITYSYTGFAQSQGNGSFPGTQIDADFANLKQFASQTVDFLALFANSDGSLKSSAIVGSTALQTAIDEAEAAAATAQSAAGAVAGSVASAQAAANSAAGSLATLQSTSLVKASNLSDLPSAATARTNLGLASFATKSSIVLADFGSNFFTADTTGRAKFADGIWTTAKIANDAVDHTKVAAGAVVQVANVMVGSVATGTTVLPVDDTVPQSTEGNEYMTLAITPKASANKLKIEVVLIASSTATGDFITAALFKDADAGALAAAFERNDTAGGKAISFTHFMTAGSTSAITFKVRAGSNSAGTTTFNGNGGARRMGGVAASSITITEIKA